MQQTVEPLHADGRGAFSQGAGKFLGQEANGNCRDEEAGRAVVVGGTGSSLLPEAVVRGLAYGVVNGILLPPVMVSCAAIIFRDPAFTPHLPRLVKLVVFSGAVHMACIGSLSSLKFAVGAVQDAGLIFLSAMASSVVTFSREEGLDEASMLSTACFILCTSTGVLGVALVMLGRLRLASVVQYLPMPVIGGYLAYIGYFCGQAGLAFACGREIRSIRDLGILADLESFLLVLPALFGGMVMYLCLRRNPSPSTLPLLMAAFLGTFFVCLWVTGTSLEEARAAGWVSAASPLLPLNRAWDYFSFANIRWGAFARVTPNLLAMIAVVAVSSSLDVAAIEMEMGRPLDFNGELQTVGWSNVVSGLFGGFTGSYIFSQTIFNMRAGVDTRMASAVTTLMLVGVAASPVSVISSLPRCFFGSLLVLISVDLMVEWLWQARVRMLNAEYIVCLATFAAIQAWGVEKGMLAGLVLAALSFAITYAQIPTVITARVKTSAVMRTFEERVILTAHQEQTVVLELQGYIFFGSAVKILSEVKEHIVWGTDQPEALDTPTGTDGFFSNEYDDGNCAVMNASYPQNERLQHHLETAAPFDGADSGSATINLASSFSSATPTVMPFPLARTMSAGGEHWSANDSGSTGSATLASITGASGRRPFHESTTSTATANDEHAPLVKSSSKIDNPERSVTHNLAVEIGAEDNSVAGQNYYGAMEEGEAGDEDGGDDSRGDALLMERMKRPHGASVGGESRAAAAAAAVAAGEGAMQTYLSLWANRGSLTDTRDGDKGLEGSSPGLSGNVGGGSVGDSGRVTRSGSVVSKAPASEQRTRRVILDFSNVVGVDATAARSCFLMLNVALRTNGADIVFSGATRKVQALLRSHGVITDDEPVFNSLDKALEWSEEMVLQERRGDLTRRRAAGRVEGTAATGPYPSPVST